MHSRRPSSSLLQSDPQSTRAQLLRHSYVQRLSIITPSERPADQKAPARSELAQWVCVVLRRHFYIERAEIIKLPVSGSAFQNEPIVRASTKDCANLDAFDIFSFGNGVGASGLATKSKKSLERICKRGVA